MTINHSASAVAPAPHAGDDRRDGPSARGRPIVLLVEDDVQTGREVLAALADHGLDGECLTRGRDVIDQVDDNRFDAIILDRMLADGMDGLSVVSALRARGVTTPILILSALSAVHDRVRGLKAGSDDYLVKPFEFVELTARIDALLRRGAAPPPQATTLRVGDLSFDLITRRVERAGHCISLVTRELQLLEFLMRQEGQVLTRAMIFETVWGYRFDDRSNTIDVHIGNLRRKLDGHGVPLIHTIRQAGYVLRAPL